MIESAAVLPTHKFNPDHHRAHFIPLLQEIFNVAVKEDLPRVLSSQDIRAIQKETESQIKTIKDLEAAQDRTAPRVDLELEKALFKARAIFRTYYCRTFRINDLPNEILTNIFRLVAWSISSPQSAISSRLWITWVCRRWRNVALADTTLWNAVWFLDAPPFDRSLAWFDRARAAPLDIRIDSNHIDGTFTAQHMEALMDRLLPKISAVRTLIVTVEHWDSILVVLDKLRAAGRSGVPINMNRIELHRTGTTYVQIGTGYEPRAHREPIVLFGGAPTPKLHYMSLNGVHVHWDSPAFTNLTTLDVRRIPLELSPGISLFRHMLSSSPNLRKLCLDGAGPLPGTPDTLPPPPPIVLQDLKILVIGDFNAQYAPYIMSHLSAPHLRDLTLMKFMGKDYCSLFKMMTGRFPAVRILTTHGVAVSAEHATVVFQWLESMPQLSYLRIANMAPIFLDLSLYAPEDIQRRILSKRVLLPKLTVVEAHSQNLDHLAEWVKKRREMRVPISTVYVGRSEMDQAQERLFQHQCTQLATEATVRIVHPGATTPEEMHFLNYI